MKTFIVILTIFNSVGVSTSTFEIHRDTIEACESVAQDAATKIQAQAHFTYVSYQCVDKQ